MANVMIIEAENFIESRDLPDSASDEERAKEIFRSQFDSLEEVEPCVQLAIERARELIGGRNPVGIHNAVVTACGSLMAMVRWNLDIDADPPIEVSRFREPLVLC